jgi:hypothetical protein
MATNFGQALLCALVAASSLTLCPVNAEESQTVVASLPGSTLGSDPVLDRAMDIIRHSREAAQTQIRRNDYKPATDEKIVRTHRNDGHTFILGGSAAIPM